MCGFSFAIPGMNWVGHRTQVCMNPSSFVNCESVVAADAELVILEVRNQLIFGHKNRFKDAKNQVEAPQCSEK